MKSSMPQTGQHDLEFISPWLSSFTDTVKRLDFRVLSEALNLIPHGSLVFTDALSG
jgi:hypothetical protein